METYPSELLKGVSPLIFVVDSILNHTAESANKNNGEPSVTGNNALGSSTIFQSFFHKITMRQTAKNVTVTQTPVKSSSTFKQAAAENDTLASILALDPQTVGVSSILGKNTKTPKMKSKSSSRPTSTPLSHHADFFSRANIVPVSHRHAFPPSKDPKGSKNAISRLNTNLSKRGVSGGNKTTNSVNGVGFGEGFSNEDYSSKIQLEIASVIGGILPSGWIEKHLHALPSVLLIVTVVDLSNTLYQQAKLEQHLTNTLEALRSSCAKKRDCPVHLVCLIQDCNRTGNVVGGISCGSPSLGSYHHRCANPVENERLANIKTVCRLSSNAITTVHICSKATYSADNLDEDDGNNGEEFDFYIEEELQKLQQSIREASMSYYLTQVRRCKKKHSNLHHDKFMELLPVAARYCFKIGVFYEFQMHDDQTRAGKSAKYWMEAYQNVLDYYRYLQALYRRQNRQSTSPSRKANTVILSSSSGGGDDMKKMVVSSPASAGVINTVQTNVSESIPDDSEIQCNTENMVLSRYAGEEDHPPPPQPSTPSSQSDGVEVALVYSPRTGNGGITIGAKSPSKQKKTQLKTQNIMGDDESLLIQSRLGDMIHQCRKVADWLNVKLLLMTSGVILKATAEPKLQYETEEYFASIVLQIRRHCQVFLSKPWSLCYDDEDGIQWEKDDGRCVTDPAWHFWQYASQQRLVLHQFTQRIFTCWNAMDSLNFDERKQCSASFQSAAAGETLLKLRLAIRREKIRLGANDVKCANVTFLADALKRVNNSNSGEGEKRQRFVGSLCGSDLITKFLEEASRDHSALALDSLLQAVQLLTAEKKHIASVSQNADIVFARLNFLIGGILKERGRYTEAIEKLKMASTPSKRFICVQQAIEMSIIECRKKSPTAREREEKEIIDLPLVMYLNPRMNSRLTPKESNYLLRSAFAPDVAKDNDETSIDWHQSTEDSDPFYFTLTFPQQTFATEGDAAPAILSLYSNLTMPILLKNIKVITNIGTVVVSLTAVKNKRECDEFAKNGLIFPKQIVSFVAKMCLPNGIIKNIDPKFHGRFNINATKPLTAGLTRLGGGVYEFHEGGTLSDPHKRTQLGGLSGCCLKVQLILAFPSAEGRQFILKLHNRCHASKLLSKSFNERDESVEKSFYEDDNNIHYAWSRPRIFSLSSGPRCLRVLPPKSNLEVTDLTALETKGRAMEGTVNRILLKLKAGSMEFCRDVKMNVVCSSSIVYPSGKTLEMFQETSLIDEEDQNASDDELPSRPPQIVKNTLSQQRYDDTGTKLPLGWKPHGNKGQGTKDEWIPVVPLLRRRGIAYTYFDIYRPLRKIFESPSKSSTSEKIGSMTCKTDYTVTISYRQIRPNHADSETNGDFITHNYDGSMRWCAPFKTKMSILSGRRTSLPSGSRHPTNLLSGTSSSIEAETIVDSDNVDVKCLLEAREAKNCLNVQVNEVVYEENHDQHCKVELVTDKHKQSNVLFSPKINDICHILRDGSKFNISFTVRPKIDNSSPLNYVTTRFGAVILDWVPISFSIADGISCGCHDECAAYHGPLPITSLYRAKFLGPVCYVEVTPFDAFKQTVPPIPKICSPFEMRYTISNKTELYQKIRVAMNAGGDDAPSDGVLVSGIISGEINLGPMEEKEFSYLMMFTTAGKSKLPTIHVSSVRYGTWIIHEGKEESIYVTP